MTRLSSLQDVPGGVATPAYDRDAHGTGIVHLGLGAFHKAHQAVYTDDALKAEGGDWRIVAVSLRSAGAVEELRPQNGMFTVISAGAEGTSARVIGSIATALAHAHGDDAAVRAALADPATRIVTITVTEKGYGIDRATGGADPSHPAIAHDLDHPDAPTGLAGLLVQALAARRAAGTPPFTVLSCDNLPGNGELTRGLILDFANRTDPDLRDWIASEVAFPSSMVDRITPAPGDDLSGKVREILGCEDYAAIETETFSQWVIEDRFPTGRPAWEAGGALFVEDVAPYEKMKLRMLNGTHSMLAYAGFLSGKRHVRDVMQDPALAALVRRHLRAAARTLDPLEGIDLGAYAEDLARRFENPNLAHETYQIAMDGTEKLPQRIFAPAVDALSAGHDIRPFSFATAAWMRYCLGHRDDGSTHTLRDPREDEIAARIAGANDADAIVVALFGLPNLVPDALRQEGPLRKEVTEVLREMLSTSVAKVLAQEG
ncbi:fructuronate reductase [Palleronia marisminoris]|uniref:Mannitol 2-dehydrogenase n=1 Tax=Palleronia marisminoris TaxID=315423 RepID=A0A1Y5SFC0_9RHOB|nr:mannitol dehydrogenase family protein [Palleronia marisminoris]SFG73637.1 fructuronate reductase [Palleronia marisminoris]SLN37830.1 Mannitol 2-dehydrogenase [Palleronia marisminoris]